MVVGSHCLGTNHQAVAGVQRVVFVGDSVTVGTPPTLSASYYRNVTADALASRFGLTAPGLTWRTANPLTGQAGQRDSGDFCVSAKWGGRTDDLMEDNSQLVDCLPESQRDKTTLVVMTLGGNDMKSAAEARARGEPEATVQALIANTAAKLDQALAWLKEPGRFPNGVFVILANNYDPTDRTGDVYLCTGAPQAGYDEAWGDRADLSGVIRQANVEYARMAAARGVDLLFMEESFCGHGFSRAQTDNLCHTPGAELYYDLSCFHPNADGHAAIVAAVLAVVDE